nr:PREDICTED: uncharacterized protein LOC109458541 [Rhinolophus sinicus]
MEHLSRNLKNENAMARERDHSLWGTQPCGEIRGKELRPPAKSHCASPGKPHARPPTHALGAPTRAVTLTAVAHAAACSGSAGLERLRGASGGSSRRLDEFSEDAAVRGASPPSPPGPGCLRNSALGLWGSKMQPKPRFTEPRANKHAQALTQTSPRPALAAAGLGHGRPGKSPGSTRGRRSRSAAKSFSSTT